jgi:hypothetical protein
MADMKTQLSAMQKQQETQTALIKLLLEQLSPQNKQASPAMFGAAPSLSRKLSNTQ